MKILAIGAKIKHPHYNQNSFKFERKLVQNLYKIKNK